jgi:hypothetical protein
MTWFLNTRIYAQGQFYPFLYNFTTIQIKINVCHIAHFHWEIYSAEIHERFPAVCKENAMPRIRASDFFQHFWGISVTDNARPREPSKSDEKICCVDMCILTGLHTATCETNRNICGTNATAMDQKRHLHKRNPKADVLNTATRWQTLAALFRYHHHRFVPSVTTVNADYYASSLLQMAAIR